MVDRRGNDVTNRCGLGQSQDFHRIGSLYSFNTEVLLQGINRNSAIRLSNLTQS